MSRYVIRTVIPERMKIINEIPVENKYQPWLPSPPNLLHAAGDIVNNASMPDCWHWDVERVVKWLRNEIGLAQYKDCFVKNFINGRRLIRVDASVCPKIGIRDLSHIKLITAGIRKLFNVELEAWDRSLSLPPRYPLTHYLLFQVPTGPMRENTSRVELFRRMGILDKEEPCPFGHWEMVEATQPDYPARRFGLMKRKSVYTRIEHQRQPKGHSYLRRSKLRHNFFLRIDTKTA
ncbi:uncharacterized protein LOC107219456 [Neodiprion lecontei]|uniref:Uncharacterized protein LOC107219456 n=1 Tax=Neodiprion lecontei TaxID=441921 RepID=A0A6J0BG62_NEOLC|nr:uncharacterized protein LOC107219456 [Neodiprion lecontei]